MRIDLHTHSDRSDGTDTPAELVRHAHAQGIDVLALTDHDTTEGWDEAADVAERSGVTLIRGIEVSARFAGSGGRRRAGPSARRRRAGHHRRGGRPRRG